MRALRNWAFLFAAVALAAAGCGGAGSTTSSGGGGGVVPDTSTPQVLLTNKPGQIELAYLSGQARSTFALGDTVGTIGISQFKDSAGRTVTVSLQDPPKVQLNGYQNQIFRINADVATITEPDTGSALSSRLFQNYRLQVTEIKQDAGSGFVASTDIRGIPDGYLAGIRLFPGRYTTQPIFLNDAMFTLTTPDDGSAPFYAFNSSVFDDANGLTLRPRLQSFLSDYLAFDLSAMSAASRPNLSTTGAAAGEAASRVYFSGDGYSLSQGGARGVFESINRTNFDPTNADANLISGRFAPPGSLGVGAPADGVSTPGTYSLLQNDPSDPDLLAQIVSLQGIWRNYQDRITNLGDTAAISFPSTRDDDQQDIVFVKHDSTKKITSMYYGYVDFGTSQIKLYPIQNITTGSIAGEVTAEVASTLTRAGNVTTSSQAIRKGTYRGLNLPGFPATGTFAVYRY